MSAILRVIAVLLVQWVGVQSCPVHEWLIRGALIGSIEQSGGRRRTDEQAGATETFVRVGELSSFTLSDQLQERKGQWSHGACTGALAESTDGRRIKG
jgi:hypothetical protein